MKKMFFVLLLCLLLTLSACYGSSSQVLNTAIEGEPIYTVYFAWEWRWEENNYNEGMSEFLQREDIRVLSITTHERKTIILYQKGQ